MSPKSHATRYSIVVPDQYSATGVFESSCGAPPQREQMPTPTRTYNTRPFEIDLTQNNDNHESNSARCAANVAIFLLNACAVSITSASSSCTRVPLSRPADDIDRRTEQYDLGKYLRDNACTSTGTKAFVEFVHHLLHFIA